MLVLSRKQGESIEFSGLDVVVRVISLKRSKVQLGIEAPRQITVHRSEKAVESQQRDDREDRTHDQGDRSQDRGDPRQADETISCDHESGSFWTASRQECQLDFSDFGTGLNEDCVGRPPCCADSRKSSDG